jgi:sulfoxide reductase heme-binding subunit YedZ
LNKPARALSSVDRRYRFVYKPLVFIACLVPGLGVLGGLLLASGIPHAIGFDLGADPVRESLDELGKTAINLLLVTLTVTPLRQLTGNAHLLRLRRMLGVFAFAYAALHFLLYVGLFQSFIWSEILKDIAKRPFITVGFLALLLLIPLAATSTNRMMRRLGRRWQSLHRLIYLIAPLAVLHYWKMLKSDYREPLIYALILVTLLGWRVIRRLRRRAVPLPASPAR